jgi:secernin
MLEALSCDTAVAVGTATADGSVIFAKNSDRRPNEAQPLHHAPRRRHPSQATVRTQYLEIPQVAETWELVGSRPHWLWGFEIGVNEWGVAIGNEAVHSREGYADPGLIGMDLIRLGLERGRTAEEAVALIGQLTERLGQGGSCEAPGHAFRTYHNSYIVADPRQAWVLETAGRRWQAEPVADRGSISNLYTLAATRAWQDPEADLTNRACRLARSRAVLAGYRDPITVDDMMALLRDHDGLERPCEQQERPSLCMHGQPGRWGETAAAMVAHLRPDRPRELTATVWTAFGSPCLSVFRPVYPFAVGLPEELDRGSTRYDPRSGWWVFERLQRLVVQAPPLASEARARLGELEARLRAEADATEGEAERLLRAGDRPAALGALRGLVDASTEQAIELARRLTDELAGPAARLAVPAIVEGWREANAEVALPPLAGAVPAITG